MQSSSAPTGYIATMIIPSKRTEMSQPATYVNEILIRRSLTFEQIRVLFDTSFTSIFFFCQSIFDLLNFQREF